MTEQATLTTETPAPAETLLADATTPAPTTVEAPAPEPETYLPADFKDVTNEDMEPTLFAEYLDDAKANGLTKKQVETQLKKGKELRDRVIQAQFQKTETVKAEWLKATETDPEIGGDKLQGALATASLAMKEVSSEFRQLLNTTGLGNHPELIKIFYRHGLTMKSDGVVPGTPAKSEKSLADRFYNS